VLFVDDEPLLLEGLKAGLYARRKDWEMHFAPGGAKALEMMGGSRFDVLVTDLRMPGIDGTTLMARVRSDWPDTVRIVLSGYADDEQSQRLVSLAHRYMSKPCEPRQLEECIDRCLATQALIQSEELRSQLGTVGALPPMPSTFAALQQALTDPGVNSSKVAAIIQRDPAVAAKVLHVCNSAFFRLPRRVSSIQQAVSYLGLSTVRSMVLSAEVFRPGKALPPELDLARLQRHALNVAALARFVAADTSFADDAFLCGLLHDIGLLVLGRQYPVEMQRALAERAAGIPLADAEHKYLGVDHGAAGAYLLGLWGFPYEIVDIVSTHELPIVTMPSALGVASALAVAHSLLATVRPEDMPTFEAGGPVLGDDYLQAIGHRESWESLTEHAATLLGAAEAT
jgi:HD-like signal output (HDOD) protein